MKYIASCSFGKDSLAAILVCLEHGIKIDSVVYCQIMFDENTGAELPEHEEWVHNHAIPLLKERYGLETTIVQAKRSYKEQFYTRKKRGKYKGDLYGFPYSLGAWCTSDLKREPLRKAQGKHGKHNQIIGIASDEHRRIKGNSRGNKYLPLVEFGITEAEAFEICRKADLLSPAYKNGTTRLGCWFCHNQKESELRKLRNNYPEYWQKLLELDLDAPEYATFKTGKTLHDYERLFQFEDRQVTFFEEEGDNEKEK